jgi:hypothetical protein
VSAEQGDFFFPFGINPRHHGDPCSIRVQKNGRENKRKNQMRRNKNKRKKAQGRENRRSDFVDIFMHFVLFRSNIMISGENFRYASFSHPC